VVAEGSAAVGVAALLGGSLRPTGPAVVVLTGRNIAASEVSKLLLATR